MDENCIVRDETIDTTDGYDDGSDDGDCDEPGTRTSSDDSAMKDVESSAKKKRKRKKVRFSPELYSKQGCALVSPAFHLVKCTCTRTA